MLKTATNFFESNSDFDVATEDFSHLEIRDNGSGLHFFYDRERTGGRALVKNFILADKPRTAIIATVTLIKKPEGCSPRIRFWIRDKNKAGQVGLEEIPADGYAEVKGAVDTSSAHTTLWSLIAFLQAFRGITLPAEGFSVAPENANQLASLLRSEDKKEVLEAIRTALAGSLTEKDLALIANRKEALAEFDKLLNDDEHFERHRAWSKSVPRAFGKASSNITNGFSATV